MADKLKSYVVNYQIEYSVQVNDHTEVTIKTKRSNPHLICREEDKDEMARHLYQCNDNLHNRILYDKIVSDLNLYGNDEDYEEKVEHKLLQTEINDIENYNNHYRVDCVSQIRSEDNIHSDERTINLYKEETE